MRLTALINRTLEHSPAARTAAAVCTELAVSVAAELNRALLNSDIRFGSLRLVLRSDADTVQRLEQLMLGVQYVHGMEVHGDVAEFGTMTGVTAALLAGAIALSERRYPDALKMSGMRPKQLHLFDSFVGLPAPESPVDADSPHVQSQLWAPGTCRGISRADLFARCSRLLAPSRVQIFDGWFSETLPHVPADTRYALLHIDCDLYASAWDVLDQVFGRGLVSEGAMIFFDDWNCNRASPEFGERRAWTECVQKYDVECSHGGDYSLAGHKVVVHRYRGMPAIEG